MHEPQRRPHLVTAVGLIGIFAGIFPILELGAVLVSPSFSAFFLPLVEKALPANTAVILASLPLIGLGDFVLGAGVLARRRWAMFGMIIRSVAGILLDYLNLQASNVLGAGIGLAANLFLILALLLPKSRLWFRRLVDGPVSPSDLTSLKRIMPTAVLQSDRRLLQRIVDGGVVLLSLVGLAAFQLWPAYQPPTFIACIVLLIAAAPVARAQMLHAPVLIALLVAFNAFVHPSQWPLPMLVPLIAWALLAASIAPLRRAVTWLRPGRPDAVSVALTLALTLSTSVILLLWIRLARPDRRDVLAQLPHPAEHATRDGRHRFRYR